MRNSEEEVIHLMRKASGSGNVFAELVMEKYQEKEEEKGKEEAEVPPMVEVPAMVEEKPEMKKKRKIANV
jgi:hypothetical protein